MDYDFQELADYLLAIGFADELQTLVVDGLVHYGDVENRRKCGDLDLLKVLLNDFGKLVVFELVKFTLSFFFVPALDAVFPNKLGVDLHH